MKTARESLDILRQAGYQNIVLAEKIGVSEEHLSRVRNGKQPANKVLQILLYLIATQPIARRIVGL